MAAIAAAPSRAFLSSFLPAAQSMILSRSSTAISPASRISVWQRLEASILPAVFLPIPGLLGGLWDGLLRAVPKKKTSHMKKRHRQMAGKALKDVTALNTCSGCGRQKRAHVLCPYCVQSIKQWMGRGFLSEKQVAETAAKSKEGANTRA